jgi:hypothetical protein
MAIHVMYRTFYFINEGEKMKISKHTVEEIYKFKKKNTGNINGVMRTLYPNMPIEKLLAKRGKINEVQD